MDYTDKCPKPIPIGLQKFAYQCEPITMEPIHGAISIRGYKPSPAGKEPYPNEEKDKVAYYDLKIERFTGNAITLSLIKSFIDGSEEIFLTTVSFSDLANRLFENNPANNWKHAAPVKQFI